MKKQLSNLVEVHAAKNELGEGPLWLKHNNSLCWVDIQKHYVYEYSIDTKQTKKWEVPKHVSLLIETEKKGTLLIGKQGGLALFNMKANSISEIITLEQENNNTRTNDGGCDPNGNLWIG